LNGENKRVQLLRIGGLFFHTDYRCEDGRFLVCFAIAAICFPGVKEGFILE
jgi:hypothetical protein